MSLIRAGALAGSVARHLRGSSRVVPRPPCNTPRPACNVSGFHLRSLASASANTPRPACNVSGFHLRSLASASAIPEGDASAGPRRKSLAALGGFTYPGPRKLSDIVKLPLLNAHGASRVREIWTEYHKHHANAIADVVSGEEFGLMMQRSERCPNFVVPVPRQGGYFTMLAQFQGRHCLVTYLEDYKKNPGTAEPYLTLTLFDDFVEKKGLALLRGEVTNRMTRDEASLVVSTLKQFYLGPRRLFDSVVAFNEKGSEFDFKAVLKVAGIAA